MNILQAKIDVDHLPIEETLLQEEAATKFSVMQNSKKEHTSSESEAGMLFDDEHPATFHRKQLNKQADARCRNSISRITWVGY